jgi:hypothetical protein
MEVDEDVAYLGLLAGDLDEAAWIAEQAELDLALRQCARSGSADECGKESERKQQATRDHRTAIRRKPLDPEHRLALCGRPHSHEGRRCNREPRRPLHDQGAAGARPIDSV